MIRQEGHAISIAKYCIAWMRWLSLVAHVAPLIQSSPCSDPFQPLFFQHGWGGWMGQSPLAGRYLKPFRLNRDKSMDGAHKAH